MEPMLFVMAILGCADDGAQCRQERLEPARYESVSACQAAIPGALLRNSDIDYPVVGASCQRQGERHVDNEGRPLPSRG